MNRLPELSVPANSNLELESVRAWKEWERAWDAPGTVRKAAGLQETEAGGSIM